MTTAEATRQPDGAAPSALGRYRDVAAVLVKYGLADVVDALHLGRHLAWGARRRSGRLPVDPAMTRAARFRLALEALGPTFVKFGQALSVRADVVPADVAAELARLQDRVAPLAPGTAERAIEAEFGQPLAAVFRSFDPTPLASASIAQVHRAVLDSGEVVAVKVRRPGIGRTIASDIEILRQLARLVERYLPAAEVIDPVGLVDEFARTIRAEQDLAREGRNIERTARNFEGDPTVKLPRVFWAHTRPGVLTLEYLEGAKVTELAGVGPFARALIARRGADAILTQVLVHGFFHADPHPGNLLVLADNVIGFLDFGIVGSIDEAMRADLARVVRAIWRRDASELAAVVLDVTEPRADVQVRALERDLAGLIETYGSVPIGELSAGEVLSDVVRVASAHRLRIPTSLMLLVKAIVTIEGVGVRLDPSFRMVEHAAPLAERLWRREYEPAAIGRRVARAVEETVRAVQAVPVDLDAILKKIRDGRLEIRFVHRNLEHFVREMDRSSNRLAFALIIAALIVGSALIIHAGRGAALYGYPVLGLAGFLVALVFGVRLTIGIMRSGRL